MKRLLIADALFPDTYPEVPGYEIIKPAVGTPFTYDEILAQLPECDAFISSFDTPITPALLDIAPKLKVISNVAVGYNNVNVDAATQRGVTICNTPDVVTEPTAELAMALLVDIARGISFSDRQMRRHEEKLTAAANMHSDVYGQTVGIIGFGRIGQAFARRALASGMKVQYYSRHRASTEVEQKYEAKYVSMEELLKTSDFISLHLPLNEHTRHTITAKELALCKPTAYLINTARGAVVDERALVEALQNGTIAGAAMDVFEFEPKVSEELRQLENTVITPHIGTSTYGVRNQMARMALQNIRSYFEGGEIHKVNFLED